MYNMASNWTLWSSSMEIVNTFGWTSVVVLSMRIAEVVGYFRIIRLIPSLGRFCIHDSFAEWKLWRALVHIDMLFEEPSTDNMCTDKVHKQCSTKRVRERLCSQYIPSSIVLLIA